MITQCSMCGNFTRKAIATRYYHKGAGLNMTDASVLCTPSELRVKATLTYSTAIDNFPKAQFLSHTLTTT
jgi:hypothetical protein